MGDDPSSTTQWSMLTLLRLSRMHGVLETGDPVVRIGFSKASNFRAGSDAWADQKLQSLTAHSPEDEALLPGSCARSSHTTDFHSDASPSATSLLHLDGRPNPFRDSARRPPAAEPENTPIDGEARGPASLFLGEMIEPKDVSRPLVHPRAGRLRACFLA